MTLLLISAYEPVKILFFKTPLLLKTSLTLLAVLFVKVELLIVPPDPDKRIAPEWKLALLFMNVELNIVPDEPGQSIAPA